MTRSACTPYRWSLAAHEDEGPARVTAVEEAAKIVECRSTAWPYPGPQVMVEVEV
jgi:hypothetical protein